MIVKIPARDLQEELQEGDIWGGKTIISVEYVRMNFQPWRVRSVRIRTNDGDQHMLHPDSSIWVDRNVRSINLLGK